MHNLVVKPVSRLWVVSVHKHLTEFVNFFMCTKQAFMLVVTTANQYVLPNLISQFNRWFLKFPTLSTIPITTITNLNTYY